MVAFEKSCSIWGERPPKMSGLEVGDEFYAGFNGSYKLYKVTQATATEITAVFKGKEDKFDRFTGKMVGGDRYSYSISHKKI